MGRETARQGRFGYSSRHLLVAVDPVKGVPAAYETLKGRSASVQVRTILQHAWAEFEHDVRYKGTIPEEHVPDLDRRFTLAAGLLELADREFSEIRDTLQATMGGQRLTVDEDDPRISASDLATFLAGQFQDAGWSRTDHYAWISGLLLELGITSLDELVAACCRRSTSRASTPGWATATRPVRSAGSTTRCSRSTAPLPRPARQRPPRGCPAHPAREAPRRLTPGSGGLQR